MAGDVKNEGQEELRVICLHVMESLLRERKLWPGSCLAVGEFDILSVAISFTHYAPMNQSPMPVQIGFQLLDVKT